MTEIPRAFDGDAPTLPPTSTKDACPSLHIHPRRGGEERGEAQRHLFLFDAPMQCPSLKAAVSEERTARRGRGGLLSKGRSQPGPSSNRPPSLCQDKSKPGRHPRNQAPSQPCVASMGPSCPLLLANNLAAFSDQMGNGTGFVSNRHHPVMSSRPCHDEAPTCLRDSMFCT